MSEVDHQTSSGRRPKHHFAMLEMCTAYPPCVWTASFGFAVVPDVARMKAGSFDSIGT